jgi:hypothetical protein
LGNGLRPCGTTRQPHRIAPANPKRDRAEHAEGAVDQPPPDRNAAKAAEDQRARNYERAGDEPEVADAEAPLTPRGCPWQAWSVGETLWLDAVVLKQAPKAKRLVNSPLKRNAALEPVLV